MYVKQIRPLDSWLNLAGLMPFDEKLPALGSASPQAVTDVNQLWTDALVNHPELGLPHVSGNDPGLRYELFRRVREILGTIAAVASDPSVKRPKSQYGTLLDPRMLDLASLPPSDPRSIALCGRGIFVSTDPYGMFLNCLEQTGEDVWSLKVCPVCDAPFLPHRVDQKACSLRCANTHRVRESRKRPSAPLPPTKKKAKRRTRVKR
jgi:hypothetical protein